MEEYITNSTYSTNDDSTITLTGDVPFSELEKHRSKAIAALGKEVSLPGFRKGHIPEDKLITHLGEMNILAEMAERAIADAYPAMITHHQLDVIGYPQISITKIAPDNPLGFTAIVAVLPDITLPDYKAIATAANKDKLSADVTDEDVTNQINDMLRQKIAYERIQKKAAAAAETQSATESDTADLPTPESEAQKAAAEEETDPTKIEVPALTDELVQSLGQPGQFNDVADFTAKIREHITVEKEREVTQKHRARITDTIIEGSSMTLPQVLIDSELNQMLAQMNEDLTRANLKFDDYLSHSKKTKDELLAEWKPAAEKRAQLQLILNEIAKAENVTPDEALVSEQVASLKEQYADADEDRVRVYVSSVLTNEAVMNMLETL